MTVPTRRTTRPCPTCAGEGTCLTSRPGGYFSESFGNWLPDEREVQCNTCYGARDTEAIECVICERLTPGDNPTDLLQAEGQCDCTDEAITAYWESVEQAAQVAA